jgi:acetolactate synthase-1/3 small subunit
MTIVINGDDQILEQVRKQLSKLVEVVKVVDYSDVEYVERDLMLVRVASPPEHRREVIELADLFRARVVDVARHQLMIELSGTEAKIEAFVELVAPYGIAELARTGVIAMPRGEKDANATPAPKQSTRVAGRADQQNQPTGDMDASQLPPG